MLLARNRRRETEVDMQNLQSEDELQSNRHVVGDGHLDDDQSDNLDLLTGSKKSIGRMPDPVDWDVRQKVNVG